MGNYEHLKDVPLWIIAFLITAGFHEFGHAYMAHRFGDDTAADAGRMTVNPLPHIDPIGLIFLIFMSISGFGVGWAKPVPVNPYNLRHPRRDMMFISLSGPVMNILLAGLFAIVYHIVPTAFDFATPIGRLLTIFLEINVILAAFNLIPIAPLDGHAIVHGLLPEKAADWWEGTARYGFIILLVLLFSGYLWKILGPIMAWILLLIRYP